MKKKIEIPAVILAIILLQGCYTQLASTRQLQVEAQSPNYTYKETRITQPAELDSVNSREADSTIIIREYYYWAYEPFLQMDPYYDFSINYYSHPYGWSRYYSDPFWSYDYYYWYYYDPYSWDYHWSNHYYGHHYSHWHSRHHHNYYGSWNWYADDSQPPQKKRDWGRRGTSRDDNNPINRNESPDYVLSGNATGTSPATTAAASPNSGQTIRRSVKSSQENSTDPVRQVVRNTGSQKPNQGTQHKTRRSVTSPDIIQLIAAKIGNSDKTVRRDSNRKHKVEKSSRSKGSRNTSSVSSSRKSSGSKSSKSSVSSSKRSPSSNKNSKSSKRSRN